MFVIIPHGLKIEFGPLKPFTLGVELLSGQVRRLVDHSQAALILLLALHEISLDGVVGHVVDHGQGISNGGDLLLLRSVSARNLMNSIMLRA